MTSNNLPTKQFFKQRDKAATDKGIVKTFNQKQKCWTETNTVWIYKSYLILFHRIIFQRCSIENCNQRATYKLKCDCRIHTVCSAHSTENINCDNEKLPYFDTKNTVNQYLRNLTIRSKIRSKYQKLYIFTYLFYRNGKQLDQKYKDDKNFRKEKMTRFREIRNSLPLHKPIVFKDSQIDDLPLRNQHSPVKKRKTNSSKCPERLSDTDSADSE